MPRVMCVPLFLKQADRQSKWKNWSSTDGTLLIKFLSLTIRRCFSIWYLHWTINFKRKETYCYDSTANVNVSQTLNQIRAPSGIPVSSTLCASFKCLSSFVPGTLPEVLLLLLFFFFFEIKKSNTTSFFHKYFNHYFLLFSRQTGSF